MQYPQKVDLGDITVRDGFLHEEIFIPTAAKLWLSEELILAGYKKIEVTNFGNTKGMERRLHSESIKMGRIPKSLFGRK